MATTEQHIILAALIKKAASIEADLVVDPGKAPSALHLVLIKARKQAIEACEQLIYADAGKPDEIRTLQHEVRLFFDLVTFAKVTIEEADQAEKELTEADEEDAHIVSDLVLGPHRIEADSTGE